MAISAKPSSYTLDTGATHAPAHLYMMDEASGTTLTDRGATGGYDLTITGADWSTDGTHGPILSFVQANTDYCSNTSISGLSGTITAAAIILAQAGTGTRDILSFGDNSQADRYTDLVYQGDENLEPRMRFDNTLETYVTSQALTHTDWDFVVLRFSDTSCDWSLNGSAFTTNTPTNSMSGLVAAINTFRIGCTAQLSPQSPWDRYMCAVMWWTASKSDAQISAIYNSGDIWSGIGLGTSALLNQQPQFYRRPQPLLRM